MSLSTSLVRSLISKSPPLAGMTVANVWPVYEEDGAQPIGAMAHLVTPQIVPTSIIGLIRTSNGVHQVVESEVTNLVGLDAILNFKTGEVVTLSISPADGFAADPATATVVTPLAGDLSNSNAANTPKNTSTGKTR